MKKITFLLFTLFYCSIFFAQPNRSVTCVYKIYTPFDVKKLKPSNLSESIAKTEPLSYILSICNNTSRFTLVNNMDVDGIDAQSLQFRKILSFGGKYVETSLDDDEIFEKKQSLGANFAIKTKISDYKWNITNESKMIDKYYCLKATCQIKGRGQGDKIIDKEVIAYFCPELNYQFGPREFCGLPGLILEVVVDNTVIGIDSITFNSQSSKTDCVQESRKNIKTFNSYIDYSLEVLGKLN